MKTITFKRSMCAVAVTAAMASMMATAIAQEQSNDEEETRRIERIEVTARRTVESIQDVPVAVSSFSDQDMERVGLGDITELQQRIPNTTLQVSRGTNSTLTAYIRGVGQQDPLWGFEPGVGVYIDDVYVARPQGAVLEVFDVERVEVLRGPQGTLYGKNTIGGAMKYVTRQLTGERELSLQGSVGSYNQRDIKIAGQTALSDNLYVGAAFASLNRDGFGEFVNTGDDNYNKELTTARINALWMPTEDLSVKFSFDTTEDNSNSRGGYRLTTSQITGEAPLNSVYDSKTAMPVDNLVETEGVSLVVDYLINDNWSFKSVTAAREGYTDTNIDFDSTELPTLNVPAIYEDEQFTQEFQLNYSSANFRFVGGLYFYEGEACGVFGTVLGGLGVTVENGGCVDTSSQALFGQGTYELSDQWSLTLGGRYTKDDKTADVFRFTYLGIKYPNDDAGDPLVTNSDFSAAADWSRFSPHASIQYRANPDLMYYASYSNGFKSGGVDMRADVSLNPDAQNPYDPEIVDTYEFGFKADLLDGRMRLNGALFYSDYQDMQVTVQRAVAAGVASQVLNAAEATVQGFELETIMQLTRNFSLNGSIGYVNAEFDSVAFFNPNTQQVEDVSNLWSFANTPETSANVGFVYEVPDLMNGDLVWTGNMAYRSETQIFEVPSMLDMDAYTLANTSLMWYSHSGSWQVGLHVKNVFDEEYRLAGYNFAAPRDAQGNIIGAGLGGEDTIVGYYGAPRTVSLTVGYRF
ncbi:TonB-dependent receptor [Aliidiomarina celeris]|uniref:TonB-dependent receptor n=1 Tax=Aliidiomarina celeris TaxID=2249428 RepID=UPI000DE9158E|nr:TonB-dependent receptor [Aliidiomarina celeris]